MSRNISLRFPALFPASAFQVEIISLPKILIAEQGSLMKIIHRYDKKRTPHFCSVPLPFFLLCIIRDPGFPDDINLDLARILQLILYAL